MCSRPPQLGPNTGSVVQGETVALMGPIIPKAKSYCKSETIELYPCVTGASTTPQDRFLAHRTGHETRQGESNSQGMNYKMRNITTTNIIVHSLMRAIKPQNVMHWSTNPGHNHTQYKTMQWHDRRHPHASQWPKPAYHHSPITESAHPEHEPIPKPKLTKSHNP